MGFFRGGAWSGRSETRVRNEFLAGDLQHPKLLNYIWTVVGLPPEHRAVLAPRISLQRVHRYFHHCMLLILLALSWAQ